MNEKNWSFTRKLVYKGMLFLFLSFMLGGLVKLARDNVAVVTSENVKYKNLPIYCVETDKKQISLTFDAAWGDEDLDDILATLEEYDAKATFFVTGDWAARFPEAIKKIHKAGHDLGNHGDNHKHMSQLSKEENKKEIKGCHDKIKALTNHDMILFRAPYGDYNESLVETAKECNYYTIQWDVDSLDWKDYGEVSIVKTVLEHKHLGNGSIILLHNGATYTRNALPTLLKGLKEAGYEMVPVSKLIYKEQFEMNHEGRQVKK